ncbi:MAG: acylphosphatase [Anaerolineae bacterium]|nr:MAG: acylphosphatase [Anaerolineae bacterium]
MDEKQVKRFHVWVRGRVQGVGFRAFVVDTAQRLGLTGWVRNVGWDTVETVAEGPQAALQELVEALKTGPRIARVDECRVEEEPFSGEFPRFEMRSSK